MSNLDNIESPPLRPLYTELSKMRRSNLNSTIEDVDQLIELLSSTRDQIAASEESWVPAQAVPLLQNDTKRHFEAITNDLKDITKAQRGFSRALDKALPEVTLPTETDAMANHTALIDRAVAMHLLREGQFSVASTFLQEGQANLRRNDTSNDRHQIDDDGDDDMSGDGQVATEASRLTSSLHSSELQNRFSEMYSILSELKAHNLLPAIEWARQNSERLQAKCSNLEFELCKLQFIWLFKGPSTNGLPDDAMNGQYGALRYARSEFGAFLPRHLKEIQQLSCAIVYGSNIAASPYDKLFEIDSTFEDVSFSFTREFCSLLGLSAESPLYVAVTAGSIALPRLIKYTTYSKSQKTEWTSENELAFETPLPESMIYHPIFVCPVSKEQVTEENPAMMLPCGHVICMDSLKNLAKGPKYKCPYCPQEGLVKDALRITL